VYNTGEDVVEGSVIVTQPGTNSNLDLIISKPMVQSIAASKVTLYELRNHFNLTLTPEPEFFSEWLEARNSLSELEKQLLDRAKANFLYLNP
jgi:hypothetical protein